MVSQKNVRFLLGLPVVANVQTATVILLKFITANILHNCNNRTNLQPYRYSAV